MSTITKVRVWNDCGFTDNAIEVPSVSNELPQPSFIINGPLNTNTPDLFSKLSVVESYRDLMNASYIEVSIDWNNGHPEQIFYGWVDAVSLKSDTDGFPQTEVYWHVDLWRTYLSQARFGYGMVNRRPLKQDDNVPPQPYPYRYLHSTYENQDLTPSDIWWVYVNITKGETSEIVVNDRLCFPVNVFSTGITTEHRIRNGGTTGKCPSFIDIEKGNWDEKLGLNPANICSAFLSPMPPQKYTGTGTEGDPIVMSWNIGTQGSEGYSTFNSSAGISFDDMPVTMTPVMSDDVKRYVITGFDGEIIGELPWGVKVTSLTCRTVMSASSGYLQYRTSVNGHLNGTCWTIPLIPIDVSQNSWSSYVYSGARQAEIDQRVLNADISKHMALQGVASGVAGNVLGGAVGGFMSGAGPIGGILGGVAGLTGSAVSAISAQATYRYQTGEVADREQAISDYKASMQPNGLIMAGTGFDAVRNGNSGINLRCIETDEYSQHVRADDIAKFGVHVSEPTADCSQLVRNGGGVQITNLIVKGDIPVEAKRYIKQRLASGVRIV